LRLWFASAGTTIAVGKLPTAAKSTLKREGERDNPDYCKVELANKAGLSHFY
jgi:hypothetical protein